MKLALMIGAPDMQAEGGYVATPIGSYQDTIGRAARLGFDGVEIMAALRLDGDIFELRQALAATNLEVAGFNSGRLFFDHGLVLLCGDNHKCAVTRSAVYDLIRLAAPFSTHINIGMFRGMPASPDQTPATERLVNIMQDLADYALRLGVGLLIEPANRKEFPFIHTTTEGIALVQRINRPNVGLMLDTFHMAVEGENMVASLEQAMPYLQHIHFLDTDRNPPSPTSTGIDIAAIMKTLARHNYQHFLSMPLIKSGGDRETASNVSYLRSLMTTAQS